MTREEAKELVTHSTMEANEVYNIIDQIFNDHEAQLKGKDRRITELEAEFEAKDKALRVAENACILGLEAEEEYLRQLKAKDEEIERFFGLIKSLWQIIDDIDTYGDMAKSDDALFRRLVENKQKERWKLPISTDGYEIFLKDNQ